jgi:hypothetical protein
MKENTCDKAIAILQATSDGDKLAPLDLKLVESAVNGFLSEELKRRCEILESKGIPLNVTTVIWRWVEGE